jgi:histidine triad (HIT) family protein
MSCIFCRIIRGEVPSQIVYRDDQVVAFRDINPQAPVHILVVPVRHIAGVADLTPADVELAGRLLLVARQLAEQEGVRDRGYRLVLNQGPDAGQSVDHLHLHLLAGRRFHWPPG